jgi:hypothetical protein
MIWTGPCKIAMTIARTLGSIRRGPHEANEDLLTERPTLGVPRLCHNAEADLLRKQQVRSSNLRVGSNPQ